MSVPRRVVDAPVSTRNPYRGLPRTMWKLMPLALIGNAWLLGASEAGKGDSTNWSDGIRMLSIVAANRVARDVVELPLRADRGLSTG